MNEQVVFDTPWFQLVARTPPGWSSPHYSIKTQDYVCVIATAAGEGLILVRQFRPAVGVVTLELPSGHVEPGETPEEAARRELLEETGFDAGPLDLLGRLAPDVGRLGNRLWCFHAPRAQRVPGLKGESGVETVLFGGSPRELMRLPDYDHALHIAPLMLAVSQGRVGLDGWDAAAPHAA